VRTLIVGHGGRESALASRMAEHSELYAFAGHANPSLQRYADASGGRLQTGDVCDPAAVAGFARAHEIDLAMVSADEPLQAGVVDALLAQGTNAVGPTRDGAEIEWNKVFARELLLDVAPEATPRLQVVDSAARVDEAIASFGAAPVVVKPSGLTGGKGVKVMGPHLASHAAAADYARSLLADRRHGDAVLIEEKIVGAEFTIQAISDGSTVVFPPSTYDYPYRFDGDEGPGTGGMGSLTMPGPTLPFMSSAHYTQACAIVKRVIERLAAEGRRFTGVMNSGFFATADGVRVIEFNARFGDPESQVVLDRLASPLAGLLAAAAAGSLAGAGPLRWAPGAAVTVVIAAEGYPAAPVKGDPIHGIDHAERVPGAHVLHAGTATDGAGRLISAGGRVLNVVGTGPDLATARDVAYRAAGAIEMRGGWYRRDIAEAAAHPPTTPAARAQASRATRDAGGGAPAAPPGP
jgi:phosphoribosylamine--glycine ligase